MQYTVSFSGYADTSVTVDADNLEDAQEKAYEEMPPGLCHHCSGGYHGTPELALGDEFTITAVYDQDGSAVFSGDTDVDRLRAEIADLKVKLAEALKGAQS